MTGLTTTVEWSGAAQFKATTGSGNVILMDGSAEHGGINNGARPMETLLSAVGGCSAFDVMLIMKNSGVEATSCEVEIQAERADAVPAVFTRINMHFKVGGENLRETIVRSAVRMSAEKYCSASIMLGKGGVEITHSYEILATKL